MIDTSPEALMRLWDKLDSHGTIDSENPGADEKMVTEAMEMLRALAAEKRTAQGGVTDEIVESACVAAVSAERFGRDVPWDVYPSDEKAAMRVVMRAALEAVWPLYTHPGADRIVTTNPAPHAAAPSTPSQTVRMEVGCATTHSAATLAEALRLLKEIKEQTPKGSGVAYASMDQLEALETMLAAHAQEPSVPDRAQK